MEERRALEERRRALLARRAELDAVIAAAQGPVPQETRVKRALLSEELLGVQDQLAVWKELDRERELRERPPAPARPARKEARDRDEEIFSRLLRSLAVRAEPREGLSLAELGRSYRAQADALRHRVQLVEELRARGPEARQAKAARLRLLRSMLRDTRSVAQICERYYDPGYYRDERYRL